MTSPASDTIPSFLQGGGAMGERIRTFDWASHPMGPPGDWPPALRMAMSLCLNASFPTAIYWGPQFALLYIQWKIGNEDERRGEDSAR